MSDTPHPPGAGAGADPSMEDILASIRRILNEDEAAPASPQADDAEPPPAGAAELPNAGGSGGSDEDDGFLVLDEGMLVGEPPPAFPVRAAVEPKALPAPALPAARLPDPDLAAFEAPAAPAMPPASAGAAGLIAPEAAAAAASSVGALMRTLSNERSAQVYRGGPTLEDLVREELRPLLKLWLDSYLPPLVERLVRQEIERVTGHLVP